MSKLKNLIRESKAAKKELVVTTVRISKEKQSFIEELSDSLSISKQDVMIMLLDEGIKIAEDELKLNESEKVTGTSKFYILNTNKKNDINDQQDMIENHIAAAYYSPWKHNIEQIQNGDVIFLYSNGLGIIGYGTGSGNTLKKDRYGDINECYYQQLSNFEVLDNPLSASEVKQILGRNIVFLKTMSSLPDGKGILDFLTGQFEQIELPHKCPKCSLVAKSKSDLEKNFGFRKVKGKDLHQSWCRNCRVSN